MFSSPSGALFLVSGNVYFHPCLGRMSNWLHNIFVNWLKLLKPPNRLMILGHGWSVFQVAGCVFENRHRSWLPRSAIPARTARQIMQDGRCVV